MNDVRATVGIDVSEAVRGLKLLQREARKTVQALREVDGGVSVNTDDGDLYAKYTRHLEILNGEHYVPKYINRQLFDAINNDEFKHLIIHHQRSDGATMSVIAAVHTFDNVVWITNYASWTRHYDLNGKAFGLDDPLRGQRAMIQAHVILLDSRITLEDLSKRYTVRDHQRTITLYGHED